MTNQKQHNNQPTQGSTPIAIGGRFLPSCSENVGVPPKDNSVIVTSPQPERVSSAQLLPAPASKNAQEKLPDIDEVIDYFMEQVKYGDIKL